MATVMWGPEMAAAYDRTPLEMFEPAMLDPVSTCSPSSPGAARRWSWRSAPGGSPCRCAPVASPCSGIELSPHMVEQLRAKPGGADIP